MDHADLVGRQRADLQSLDTHLDLAILGSCEMWRSARAF